MKDQIEALSRSTSQTETIDWDAIYRLELSRVYNYFVYRVESEDLAQDLVAETFERAWKFRGRYRRTIAAIPTWIFGIARNVLKENFRKCRKREKTTEASSKIEDIPAKVDLETDFQRQQTNEQLRRMLIDLKDREQDLIALKYGAGLTNREIANITRLSETNVGSKLHRIVTGLRNRWEKDDER